MKNKYFHTVENRSWIFAKTMEKDGSREISTLKKLADIPITRYLKIKMDVNPFNRDWYGYFDKRQSAKLQFATRKV
ncbi:MAG: hypothetical protein WCZ43_09275 [Proteiniphilum sp.]